MNKEIEKEIGNELENRKFIGKRKMTRFPYEFVFPNSFFISFSIS